MTPPTLGTRSRRLLRALALGSVTSLALAACGGDDGGGDGAAGGTIEYWLWDANQQPAYQKCADAFTAANPDLTVEITQRGWDDYWATLQTGFQSDTAPDVFTDHLSKYPEFVNNGVISPLDDLIPEIDTSLYAEGLAELWVAQDGKRYGLPKDWDTVALFYNTAMTEEAGITAEQMSTLTWNPEDGGTYEDVIAKLTVDANGVRGDEPGFDKDNVEVYGLGLPGSGAGNGQTEWSFFTGTTGWTHTNTNPWGDQYNYDDPRFQEAIAWWKGLIDKGYMPPLEATVGASMNDNFGAGQAAINPNGSWMIGTYAGYEGIELGIAPTPIGPSGERASMFNGLADSIFAGTDNEEGAAQWVAFLGSAECQSIVAKEAVVFPAIQSAIEEAKAAFEAQGIDVTPFTVHVDEGTTFLFPITDHAADINAIMQPAMDNVMSGNAEVSSLTAANDQVNALFQ
jgi:multiple sugar transport system substrate-binding protein